MPKVSTKTITFPLAGVVRSRGLREQDRPYSSPWAVNVRGVDSFERRSRGGSRPVFGLACDADFSSISAINEMMHVDKNGALQRKVIVVGDGACQIATLGDDGGAITSIPYLAEGSNTIISEAGADIVFDYRLDPDHLDFASPVSTTMLSGKLFIAYPVKLRMFDPNEATITDVSGAPAGQPVVAAYRGRLFLAGADHIWYASRQADYTDWDLSANIGDVGMPVAGQLESSMRVGETIKAMIPRGDSSLTFMTQNSIWVMNGDPTTGILTKVCDGVGLVSSSAWDVTPDGVMLFVSGGGLYVYGLGSSTPPKSFSDERIPDELKDIDTSANVVVVGYDGASKGFHVSVTPLAVGLGYHYWVDLENKAIWPASFQDGHQPVAAAQIRGSGLPEAVFGCKDGKLRKFGGGGTESVESHVLIGPIRITSEDMSDGLLSEVHGIMGDGSGDVSWGIVAASSAEAAEKAAKAAVDGDTSGVAASGTFGEGRTSVARPRVRGPWIVLWLHSTDAWAYEAVVLKMQHLGRLRV